MAIVSSCFIYYINYA